MSFYLREEMEEMSNAQRSYLRRFWMNNYAINVERIPDDYTIADLHDNRFCRPAVTVGGAPLDEGTLKLIAPLLSGENPIHSVVCDKALPRVLPYFRPTFVAAVNTELTPAVELKKWFADSKDMALIVPATVHPKTVELWKGDVYWMNPDNIDPDIVDKIEQETGIQRFHKGLNVGEFSVAMASFMRPCEVVMFGMWYAFKTRKEVMDTWGDEQDYNIVELCEDGEVWWATVTWLSGRIKFLEFCKALKEQGCQVHNASEGGILYHPELCPPMTPEEFVERWKI